ncbi:PaaX family transcriptional regulator C-terminal domain-containing protein [Arthrobacter sp. JSM 101049]|uniref:PaaX family transcriptional regulator n=1 Tax=Arthrobacter sp. JSM 101049 TaxID=929097 RepID=UPI003565FD08
MPKPLLQELIVTLYGLYGRSGLLPVAHLVALLADLGVEEGAARSTVSRLKSKGVLERTDGTTPVAYRLSPAVLDGFHAGDERIFTPRRSEPGDPWALVVFSVPETERKRRYELRTELTSLGFGFVAAGVAIAPATVLDQALDRLAARGLTRYLEHFTGQYGEGEVLRERIGQWWDLGELDAAYGEFVADYDPVVQQWSARTEAAPDLDEDGRREAFAQYIPLLTRWRRFPYRDPNIALELLPVGWKAPRAKLVFLQLHGMLSGPAQDHARSVLGASV